MSNCCSTARAAVAILQEQLQHSMSNCCSTARGAVTILQEQLLQQQDYTLDEGYGCSIFFSSSFHTAGDTVAACTARVNVAAQHQQLFQQQRQLTAAADAANSQFHFSSNWSRVENMQEPDLNLAMACLFSLLSNYITVYSWLTLCCSWNLSPSLGPFACCWGQGRGDPGCI
jgi:hypothetical protein